MVQTITEYVSYFEAGEDMTDEEYGIYMRTIHKFAYLDIEPDYSVLPPLVKAALRTVIASVRKNKEDRVNGSKGGAKTGNQNARKKQPEQDMQNNPPCFSETTNVKENVNDNVNVNEYVNEYVSECESVIENVDLPTGYAKQIFNLYKELGLPCCNSNEAMWEATEFGKAYDTLRRCYKGLHSNDLMAAIRNYSSILKDERVYSGFQKSIKSFSRFVSWDRFTDFLPCNFDINKFTNWSGQKPEKKTVGANRAIELLREVQNEQKRIPE